MGNSDPENATENQNQEGLENGDTQTNIKTTNDNKILKDQNLEERPHSSKSGLQQTSSDAGTSSQTPDSCDAKNSIKNKGFPTRNAAKHMETLNELMVTLNELMLQFSQGAKTLAMTAEVVTEVARVIKIGQLRTDQIQPDETCKNETKSANSVTINEVSSTVISEAVIKTN